MSKHIGDFPGFNTLRQSVRVLARAPGFTCFVVLLLGLSIGANTALFTVINALLLRPLPYHNPEELVELSAARIRLPLADIQTLRSVTGVAAFTARGFNVDSGEGPKNVYGQRVSPNLFSVLGVRAALGRTIAAGDENNRVVMLSYDYWRRTSGDPNIVGRTLNLENDSYTIVGVMGPDFTLQVRDSNLFVPHAHFDGRIVARLAPGATRMDVQAEMLSSVQQLKLAPAGFRPESVRALTLKEAFRPGDARNLFAWQGAVALVLLITCANVGNLLLVRSSARRREIAIRTAVGGGRWQVARQLLMESALLALMGGVVGIVIGAAGVRYLHPYLPVTFARTLRGADPLGVDLNIVAFTFGAALLTVLLFGVAPSLTAFRVDVVSNLRDAGRGLTPDRQRLGQVLVASEVALALVLLIGAGLTVKSLAGLERAYLGFSADHLLRVAVEFNHGLPAFEAATSRVAAIPGVENVGVLYPQFFPFGGPAVRGAVFHIAGRNEGEARAEVYTANPAYFRTVRIPLLKGRLFADADTANSQPVALISDVVAKRYWPGVDPVGASIRLSADDPASPWVTVVGVVGDVRNPVGRDLQPTAYRPLSQNTPTSAILLVRTRGEPMTLAPAIQRELRALYPAAPEFRVADLQRAVESYISPQRFSTSVFGSFAFIGLLLAAIGVYGVMRYWVSVRIPEIGVRIALGASRQNVLGLVLRKALGATMAGVVAGVIASLALHRAMESQIYGVSPTDPAVFACVAIFMTVVACAAASLPARWASGIDPIRALRHD